MKRLDLATINWRQDGMTQRYVGDNAEELTKPTKMSPIQLANALTYCENFYNPYAEELMRRVGTLEKFNNTTSIEEQAKILRSAGKAFNILIF